MWDTERKTENVWLSIADLPQALHAVARDSKEYVSDLAAERMRLIPKGTLLVSFKLTLGRLAYAGRDLFSNEAIASLHDIDQQQISKEFLYWALTAFDWDKAAEGDQKIKGKTLNKAKLKRISIPLPPREEQQRIVAILNEAFEGLDRARANAEANLQSARELFDRAEETVLNKDGKVDGKIVRLSDVAELRGGFAFKSRQYAESGHFVLRTVNITSEGTITKSNPKFIPENEVERHRKFALKPFDTLFVMVGATLGKTGLVHPRDLPALLNQNMWVIRAKAKNIDPRFLYHVFRKVTRPAMEKATGTARGFLKRDDVRTLSFFLPTLDHQTALVEEIVEMQSQSLSAEQEYKRKIHSLDDLRQSLLQKAFAGELT